MTNQNFKHFPGEMIMNNIKYQIFYQLGKTKVLKLLKYMYTSRVPGLNVHERVINVEPIRGQRA